MATSAPFVAHSVLFDNILSKKNITQLENICERFFLEKYNITITQDHISYIPTLLNNIVRYYNKNPPCPSLQEVNKIAMQNMKERILQTSKETLDAQHMQISTLNEVRNTDPNNENDQNDQNDLSDANPSGVTEDEFFIKLKKLENTRNIVSETLIAAKPVNNTPFLTQPTQNTLQLQPIVIQPVDTHTQRVSNTLIKSIIINASKRDWIYFHDRNIFLWSGIQNEVSNYILSNVLLPKRISKTTPVVILEITGAGNKIMEFVLTLHTCGVTWDTWKCVHEGIIQNISCPWTIKLLDENKVTIRNLGKDGSKIISASRLYNNNMQITLEPHMNCIEKDTQLKCVKDNTIIIVTVVSITGKNIEIMHEVDDALTIVNSQTYIDCTVCNLSFQPYIIIDYALNG